MSRVGKIGGSTVAGILKISPWSSPFAEWARCVGLAPEREDSQRFMIGREVEGALSNLFTKETGLIVAGEQMELVHPRHRQFVGHTDGLAFDGNVEEPTIDLAIAGVEHKTQFGKPWDEVPPYYLCQANHYMWLSGLDRWFFSVLFGGFVYRVYEVKADRSDMAFQARRAWRFWRDHVLTGIPPETDGSDATAEAIAAAWPKHEPGKRIAIDDIAHLLSLRDEYAALESAATKLAEARSEVENRIKHAMGDAELATVADEPVLSLRTQTRKVSASESTFRVLRNASKKDKESA